MSTTCKIYLLIMTEVVTTSIMLLIGRRFLIHFCNLVLGGAQETAGRVFTKSECKPFKKKKKSMPE